jgi:hypothetical protein
LENFRSGTHINFLYEGSSIEGSPALCTNGVTTGYACG